MTALVLTTLASLAIIIAAACGDDDDAGGPFELVVSPEFIQGLYGDIPNTALVTIEDEAGSSGEVTLEATSDDLEMSIEPSTIEDGEVAELTITSEPVTDDREVTVTVTATRGDEERTVTKNVVVRPGTDDLGPMANEILDLFLPWLEENQPEFGLGPDTEFEGRIVAPGLLIVSHYAFFTDEYEVGVAWHITIPPDDWSDLYIRPRDELTPTAAFRVSSWTKALEGGDYEITETTVPAEVMR
jgi:hypothetical protein